MHIATGPTSYDDTFKNEDLTHASLKFGHSSTAYHDTNLTTVYADTFKMQDLAHASLKNKKISTPYRSTNWHNGP